MIRKRSSKGCHLLFSLHGPLAISGYTLWIYLLALVLVWTMAGFKRLFFFFFGRNLFCAMNCHILLKLQTYISECRTLWIFLNSMACILDTSILVQFQCIPFMLQNLAKEVEERHFLNLYQVNVGFLYRKGAPNQSTKICKASTNRKREKLTKIQSQQVA